MNSFLDRVSIWWTKRKTTDTDLSVDLDNITTTITGLEDMKASQSIKHEKIKKEGSRLKSTNIHFFAEDDHKQNDNLVTFKDLSKILSDRENQIIKDRNRWEKTFESIPDILLIVDKDRRIIKANRAFYNTSNLTPKDILGKTCYQILLGSSHNCTFYDNKYNKILGTCICSITEKTEYVNIDNEYLKGVFLFSVASIKNNEDVEEDSIILLRDVTKLKKIESDLQQKRNMIDCISKIGNYLMQDMRWKDVISLVLEHLVTMLNFEVGMVLQRDEENSDLLRVSDYYSTIPFDCLKINEFLGSDKFKEFEKKKNYLSKGIKNSVFRSDLDLKNKSFRIFNSINLKGIVCTSIRTTDLDSEIPSYYLVLCTKQIPEKGFDEIYVRTIKTISNLLGSFLAKLMIQESLREKEIYFTTLINNHVVEYAYRINIKKKVFTYVSKNFSDLVNLDSTSLIGKKIDDLFVESEQYLKDLHGIVDKLTIEEQTVHGVFSLVHGGKEEKHEQIIRGIFSPSNKLIELQCVGKKI